MKKHLRFGFVFLVMTQFLAAAHAYEPKYPSKFQCKFIGEKIFRGTAEGPIEIKGSMLAPDLLEDVVLDLGHSEDAAVRFVTYETRTDKTYMPTKHVDYQRFLLKGDAEGQYGCETYALILPKRPEVGSFKSILAGKNCPGISGGYQEIVCRIPAKPKVYPIP